MADDPREPQSLGEVLHRARQISGEQRPRPWPVEDWAGRDPRLKALDEAMAAAVAAVVRERAERAEAKLAEVRRTVATFITHYGHSTAASFKVAQDLAEAVRQVLDREPLETQERSDEKEAGRGEY